LQGKSEKAQQLLKEREQIWTAANVGRRNTANKERLLMLLWKCVQEDLQARLDATLEESDRKADELGKAKKQVRRQQCLSVHSKTQPFGLRSKSLKRKLKQSRNRSPRVYQ
jgi:hypothetical protein